MTVQTGFGLTAQEYYYYGAGAQDLVPVPDTVIRNLINFRAVMQSHIAIGQVDSGQSVTMDVYPTSGNTGLPPGAPSVTNNQWQTLTFTLTAVMDYIGRNGNDYFNGFIKNVNVAGRAYPLDDDLINSNVIRNAAASLGSELFNGSNYSNANNGTVTTIVSGESWDVVSPAGAANNFSNGGVVQPFPGLTVGNTYRYAVSSDRPVNLAVYNSSFTLLSSAANATEITFTVADATTRIFVCPSDTQTVRVSSASVR